MTHRYHSINEYLKNKHGKKYIKLSIDGGFTCPNRDGTLSYGGCMFCSEKGSGEFAGDLSTGDFSIEGQVESQKHLMSQKWQSDHYIAYFQNFTNTYDTVESLKWRYDRALACSNVEGLAISTRADCLDGQKIQMLKSYSDLDVFWLELGLQTIHSQSRAFLNLHLSMDTFYETFHRLKEAGIPCVIHIIAGLPNESLDDFLMTVNYVNSLKPFGVKIHMLNILKYTALGNYYINHPFDLLDRDTYIQWVASALELLDPEITIHRMTGDGPKDILIEPKWILDKRRVLNGIEKYLKENHITQGIKKTDVG